MPVSETSVGNGLILLSHEPVAGHNALVEAFESTDVVQQPLSPTEYAAKLFVRARPSVQSLESIVLHVPANAKFIVATDSDFSQETLLPQEDVDYLASILALVPAATAHGVSDMSATRLEQLINAGIKLDIDHIDADECCALPPDILKLSKQHNIKLLAHHDAQGLPDSDLDRISKLTNQNVRKWKACLRTTTFHSHRQVIASTQYHILL